MATVLYSVKHVVEIKVERPVSICLTFRLQSSKPNNILRLESQSLIIWRVFE